MNLNCLVVDDEPLALEILESYINKLPNLTLVQTCNNALEAFEVISQKQIDLLFLDIQMPKLTGMEFLKGLKQPPSVILTTAYRDYAIQSYELNVVDYLLKPFSFERFFKAVNKVSPMPNSSDSESFIYLKMDKRVVKVCLKDILFIESMKDYIKVKTATQEVISHQKISYMEEHLPKDLFMRVHRSFIISIPNIQAYSATNVELDGHSIPIGRNYKDIVIPQLNQNLF